MYGYCFARIAANEQLDVPAAEDSFRRGLRLARSLGGTRSQAARLASALHGRLLYDRNEIAANNSGRADRALHQARFLLATCLSSAARRPRTSWRQPPRPALASGSSDSCWMAGPRSSRSPRPFRASWTAVDGVRSGRRSPSTFLADILGAARPP
ncbi:hypothetical protein [Rhodococcus koreensis]|uniref:hypothetical protein n=1 Tax=Rhodococcus koreensis TaxID=99653 RepID=UPI00366E2B87